MGNDRLLDNKQIHAFAEKWLEIFKEENISLAEKTMGEDCASLGFIMDGGDAICEKYPGIMRNHNELLKQINTITDITLLGSGIYSQWRYYQHWACSPWDTEWFMIALQRLYEMTNK